MSRSAHRRRALEGHTRSSKPAAAATCRLTRGQFAARLDAFDRHVHATPHIDEFCSSSTWVVPASDHLMPERESFVFETDAGFIALMRGTHAQGWRYLEPLEAMWCLASPLVGADATRLTAELQGIARAHERDWEIMLLAGLPQGSGLLNAAAEKMSQRWVVATASPTVRHVASLEGGMDGYLSRRSRGTRKSLRQSARRASQAGIEFQPGHRGPDLPFGDVFDRILAVESRSWKGRAGDGLMLPGMRQFYRAMAPRLSERGDLRVWFARQDDRDIAYVLGGVSGATYRGLQFSFDDEFRGLGLGNLCQLHQIEELCDQNVELYDLGTATAGGYKHRWAEREVASETLIVHR